MNNDLCTTFLLQLGNERGRVFRNKYHEIFGFISEYELYLINNIRSNRKQWKLSQNEVYHYLTLRISGHV